MAFRGSTHRGTPVTSVKAGNNQGMGAGKPSGYEGTSRARNPGANFTSDTRGYQSSERSGTPYHSQDGNGPETRRLVTRDAHGRDVVSEHGMRMNDPASNGAGVVFDGANNREAGYQPHQHPMIDPPVPEHAPNFKPEWIQEENRAHLGTAIEHLAGEGLVELGGVMSRGMVGTTKPHDPATILTSDDDYPGK